MVPGLLFICSLCGLNGISYLLCNVGMGEEPKKKRLHVLFIVQSKVKTNKQTKKASIVKKNNKENRYS